MSHPLLDVKDLVTSVGYGPLNKKIIDSISFEIAHGETVALVGESGSGKSMTAYSIMRLLPQAIRVNQGEVLFSERNTEIPTDLLGITEAKMRNIRGRKIAMIFQEPMTSFNPVMTIGDQIIESLKHDAPNLDKKALFSETYDLLDLVGIKEPKRSAHEYPHQFSGGMLQRAMIAMALAGKPELLVADEPTTALDVTIQAQVLDLLKDIQKERKMAMMLVTHDLGIVKEMADRVLVMRHGQLIEENSTEQFYSDPKHDYSKALFAALPSLEKRGTKLESDSVIHRESAGNGNPITLGQSILKITGLKTWYPIKKGILKRTVGHVKAVDDVSLSINAGETVALVGESGSGKSTLARSIVGLEKTHAGEIWFNDTDLSKLNNREMREQLRDIQFIFQDPYSSMNPRMRVLEIVSEGIKALKTETDPDAIEAQVVELLRLTGLPEDSLYRYPHEFSGGQRQRICIARALAVKPKLLICDEPTSALDVSIQAQILNLLEELQAELGLAYLFITHDIGVVSYIADRIAVMQAGKIVEQGDAEQILLKPKTEYTQTLMAAIPKI